MKKRSVLFDLDGVLLDSRANMALAWAQVQSRCGVTVPFDDYFSRIGKPFAAILSELNLADRVAEIEPVYRVASASHIDSTPFFPGVPETLQRLALAGLLLGIVTSKDEPRTRAVLRRLPSPFASVQTPRSGARGKPAPDHLLLALVDLATDPAEAVYVGDMLSDFEAADRAGVFYLHAAWGYGAPPQHRGFLDVLPSIADLPEALGL